LRSPCWAAALGVLLAAAAPAGAGDRQAFQAALDAQAKGNLDQAEKGYLELLDSTGPDATICFNLALLEESRHRLGSARAYLEQAARLAPRDRAIRAELVGVVVRCEQPDPPPRSWVHAVGRWAACHVTLKEALALETAAFALGVAGVGWWLVRPVPPRWLRAVLLGVAAVWLLLGALAAGKLTEELGPRPAVVAASGAVLRTGPGDEFGEVAPLPEGSKLRLLGRSRAELGGAGLLRRRTDDGALWLEAQLASGARGFVSAAAVMPT